MNMVYDTLERLRCRGALEGAREWRAWRACGSKMITATTFRPWQLPGCWFQGIPKCMSMETLIRQCVQFPVGQKLPSIGILWPPTALYISSQRDFITSYHVTLEKLPSVYDNKNFSEATTDLPKAEVGCGGGVGTCHESNEHGILR